MYSNLATGRQWRQVRQTIKPVPDMTYNVFSGTLDPTQSIRQGRMC